MRLTLYINRSTQYKGIQRLTYTVFSMLFQFLRIVFMNIFVYISVFNSLYRLYSLVTKKAPFCDKSHSLSHINKILISYIFTYFLIYKFGLK